MHQRAAEKRTRRAELAVAVSDAWQRRGIATILIATLMRFAHLHGFRSFTSMVLPDNERMLGQARKLKFAITYDATEHLMHISRPLQESQLPAGELRGTACGFGEIPG